MSEREIELAEKIGKLLAVMTETERAYTLGFLDGLEVSKIEKERDEKREKTNQTVKE